MKDKVPPLDYETPTPRTGVRVWALLAAIFAPSFITAAIISACEWPSRHWFTNGVYSSGLCFVVPVGIGSFFLWRARLPMPVFVGIGLAYAILQVAWIFAFGISFGCGMFGKCL